MNKLVEGIHLSGYAFTESEEIIRNNVIINPLTPFHEDGSNLTITFLSLNRSSLSIRLLASIQTYLPQFRGKILIFDNGSQLNELNELKSFASKMQFPIKIHEAQNNLGVAGGRNKAAELIETEWFMALDNDIYFIENPLSPIKECIDKLGVSFLNLPLLNNDKHTVYRIGGNLFFKEYKDSYAVDCPPSFNVGLKSELDLPQPFLSNCLFGTASVYKTDKFIQLNGFDDKMLIGFEDLDFSIKLYKEGIKIGNLNKFCAIHGHDAPLSPTDLDYEKTRFNRNILQKSGNYFHKKHNIYAWTDKVSDWVDVREKDLLLESENLNYIEQIALHNQTKSINLTNKNDNNIPRIALIADLKNWAFHNYCNQIVKHLGHKYNFQIFFLADYPEIENLFLDVKEFDLIHFFWREGLFSILKEYSIYSISQKGWDFHDFIINIIAKSNITTSIYDHLFLKTKEIEEREILFNALSVGYATVSKRLEKLYSEIPNYPKPFGAIEDGVDLEYFKPQNLDRLTNHNKEIVIGWVGNSKWGMSDGIDHKGLETIIKPVVDNLRNKGFNVSGFYADRQERWIPYNEMNDYYNSIDIYVCASDIEGTPNPILEAMACGIPVITTDVGMVPQLFGPLQKKYVLSERTVDSLQSKLIELIKNPKQRKALSIENLENIKKWSWENQCRKWDDFFQSVLSDINNDEIRKQRDSGRIMRFELFFANVEKKNLQKAIQEVQTNLKTAENRIEELENWTIDLQSLVKTSENRILELENWAEELKTVIAEANEQIKSKQQEIEIINGDLSRKNYEYEKLLSNQNQLEQELNKANYTISGMQESKFWKLRNKMVTIKEIVTFNSKNK